MNLQKNEKNYGHFNSNLFFFPLRSIVKILAIDPFPALQFIL